MISRCAASWDVSPVHAYKSLIACFKPMAQCIIVYWRDIPAQVLIRAGRKTARRQLSSRFEQSIDRCAMKSGAADMDSYLNEWRRADPQPCGDDLEAEADRTSAELEAAYPQQRLVRLIDQNGYETDSTT